jgi:hypothetical protein
MSVARMCACSTNGPVNKAQYLSFFHYGFEALMVNEFHGVDNLDFHPSGFRLAGRWARRAACGVACSRLRWTVRT